LSGLFTKIGKRKRSKAEAVALARYNASLRKRAEIATPSDQKVGPAGPAILSIEKIKQAILLARGEKVILDADLAQLYGVTTRTLNQAVKRNQARFPEDFAFQLTWDEAASLRSQFVISKPGRGGRRYAPYAFTEHGAIMGATVLNSPRAVQVSVYVVRAFVQLRRMLAQNKELAAKLADLERKVGDHDQKIIALVQAIRQLMAPAPEPPRKPIGFQSEIQP
jgi:hypothetical protein